MVVLNTKQYVTVIKPDVTNIGAAAFIFLKSMISAAKTIKPTTKYPAHINEDDNA